MEKIWVKIEENFHAIYVLKENPFLYKFIKVDYISKKVSHGSVDLRSTLVNPILIELNHKEKLKDSVEYLLLAFKQHGFSRYTKKQTIFSSKEELELYIKSLKNSQKEFSY